MTTQPTLLDYQSVLGKTSGRKDVPEGPQGSVIPTSPSGTPQDIVKKEKISVSGTKTVNHASEGRKTQNKGNNTSRTSWTDDQWRKEYWKNTNEHPRDLMKRAIEREDGKSALIIDHILNGYHTDNRKRAKRDSDDFDPDGNWYLLVQLLNMMREGK